MSYYIPLLTVYFTSGLSGITSILSATFFRDTLSLPAETLIEIGVYTMLPWSIKMFFGTIIDSVKLFGNNRKSYILLGQLLVTLSVVLTIDNTFAQVLMSYVGVYSAILLAGLIGSIGSVVSDIVADVMQIELVSRYNPRELARVQILSRLSLSIGVLIGAYFSKYIAVMPMEEGFAYLLIGPILTCLVTSTIRIPTLNHTLPPLNKQLLLGGLFYGLFMLFSGKYLGLEYSFLGSLLIITILFIPIIKTLDNKLLFVLTMLSIFLFRLTPGVGPAGNWWYVNSLKFDQVFLGNLNFTSALSGLIILYLLRKKAVEMSIFKFMSILTLIGTIFSIPDILIYYNLTFGIDPKSIVIFNTIAVSSLASLAMIPMGVLVAINSPPKNRAVYTTMVASLMNISLVGSDVITKFLVELYPVSRSDFSNMGLLLIHSLTWGTGLSIIGLGILFIIRGKSHE